MKKTFARLMKADGVMAAAVAAGILMGTVNRLEAVEVPSTTLLRGPYVQMTTKTTAILRWRTEEPAFTQAWIGDEPDDLGDEIINFDTTTEHSVQLRNLTPGTRYYYAIGDGIGQLAGGADYYFKTSPATPQPTRIWVIGDSGTAGVGNFGSWLVRDAYYAYAGSRDTDVWLMLGDNAYGVGTDYEYQLAVFDTYPTLLRQSAVWSTLGNHETYAPLPGGGLSYFDIFDFPTQGEAGGVASGTENYYSFDYGDVHFVCLDSELSVREPGSPMLTWLEEDLAANAKEWVIAFWHSPPYTKGSHDSDNLFDSGGNMAQMRANVNPLLERYGVDLVLGGHSHDYERSFLMKGHYGFSWELAPTMVLDRGSGQVEDTGAYLKATSGPHTGEGTVYIVAGSSGWATFQTGFHPIMHAAHLTRGSLVIDVDDGRMDVRYLRDTGTIDDHFTILKGAPTEVFRFTSIRVVDGNVVAKWKTVAGRTYRVEKTVSLENGPWVPISDNIVASGATTLWEDVVGPEDSKCFYRVVQID
jgi:hypothetical protein